jgi:hypothetical protein
MRDAALHQKDTDSPALSNASSRMRDEDLDSTVPMLRKVLSMSFPSLRKVIKMSLLCTAAMKVF